MNRYRKGKEGKEKIDDKKEKIDEDFEAQKPDSKELTSFDE